MNYGMIINIDAVVLESEVNVINAMFDYYDKAYLFIENYHGDIEKCNIIQEQLIMESVNESKKGILKRLFSLLKLLKQLARRAIDNVKKVLKNTINRVFGKKSDNNSTIIEIEEPVDMKNIISFTDKLLNIDIFRNDINVYELEDELYNIFEEKGGMTTHIDQVIDKMEHVTKVIERIETKIDDINKRVDEVDNITNEGGQYVSQLYRFCGILKRLLSEYINLTKDVDSKIKESVSSNNNVIDDKYRIGLYCVRYQKGVSEPMNPDLEDKIFKLGLICRSTNNYEEYKSAYDELCDILGFHKDSVFVSGCSSIYNLEDGYFVWKVKDLRETATMTLKPGTKLYHTSYHKGLTELKPAFRATGGVYDNDKFDIAMNQDTMYPTKRVYFFLKNPGARYTTDNTGKYKSREDIYVYEYTVDSPMKVKVDTEAGGSSYRKSIFIETDSPIPVKDVTEDFKD